LFYSAGTVYQATHTLDIEQLGGLIKKMPQTATLFLIAALAICGLPPFNGFISEFLIYSGLIKGILESPLISTVFLVSSVLGLVIIGGLAMLCFTKAFGVIFLGNERHQLPATVHEAEFTKLFPKYLIATLIILIGIVPQIFVKAISGPTALFTGKNILQQEPVAFIETLQAVSLAVIALILLSLIIWWLRKMVTRSAVIVESSTWGCGYAAPTAKLQYTANSFVRPFRKLIHPLLMMNKTENALIGIFPNPVHSETHPYDKLERVIIDIPLKYLKGFIGQFRFLQNGNPQFYILYGVVFIFIVITIPLLMNALAYLNELIKQIGQ
jgi:NADH:ubiquinone oxidoreductase subunit 5 (subunit L)/multisubunit Na+/H+ antiporter MnhA subunit